MTTYLDHWGFAKAPFDNALSESLFCEVGLHGEAVNRMLYVIRDGHLGWGLLTGEVGCGKSLSLKVLQSRLQSWRYHVLLLESPPASFDDLLCEIVSRLERPQASRLRSSRDLRPKAANRYELLCRFREELWHKVGRIGRRLVLLVDEAQGLPAETFMEIKNLCNFAEGNECPLGVVFAGQPELAEKIAVLPEIHQRVGLRCHLRPLQPVETHAYVQARLRAAGYPGGMLFDEEACAAMASESGGVPRLLNRIAHLALDWAFSLKQDRIGAELVRRVAEDSLHQEVRLFGGAAA